MKSFVGLKDKQCLNNNKSLPKWSYTWLGKIGYVQERIALDWEHKTSMDLHPMTEISEGRSHKETVLLKHSLPVGLSAKAQEVGTFRKNTLMSVFILFHFILFFIMQVRCRAQSGELNLSRLGIYEAFSFMDSGNLPVTLFCYLRGYFRIYSVNIYQSAFKW